MAGPRARAGPCRLGVDCALLGSIAGVCHRPSRRQFSTGLECDRGAGQSGFAVAALSMGLVIHAFWTCVAAVACTLRAGGLGVGRSMDPAIRLDIAGLAGFVRGGWMAGGHRALLNRPRLGDPDPGAWGTVVDYLGCLRAWLGCPVVALLPVLRVGSGRRPLCLFIRGLMGADRGLDGARWARS